MVTTRFTSSLDSVDHFELEICHHSFCCVRRIGRPNPWPLIHCFENCSVLEITPASIDRSRMLPFDADTGLDEPEEQQIEEVCKYVKLIR